MSVTPLENQTAQAPRGRCPQPAPERPPARTASRRKGAPPRRDEGGRREFAHSLAWAKIQVNACEIEFRSAGGAAMPGADARAAAAAAPGARGGFARRRAWFIRWRGDCGALRRRAPDGRKESPT
ncbi:hypothetical protein ACFFJB_04635 [Camelimonas abortus]|uniref:hypothetical protein n=1 Tax=Camelimonas abortus TaxID=1017184 RepID=UPI0035EE8616